MTIKQVSKGHLAHTLGARLTRMPTHIRDLVFSGASTMAVDGVTYRVISDEQASLVHKAAPRIEAELEPAGSPLDRLSAEIRAEQAADRARRFGDDPVPSPAVVAALRAESSKPAEKRAKPETTQELRVRKQRADDARRAATAARMPAKGSKLRKLFEGGGGPNGDAA